MPSSVVSSTMASSAWRSGSAARVESSWSRRSRSAAVAATSAASSALRRRARAVGRGGQVDLEVGVRRDDGADVPALDHDPRRPAGDDLALPGDEQLAHGGHGRDGRHGAGHLGPADRRRRRRRRSTATCGAAGSVPIDSSVSQAIFVTRPRRRVDAGLQHRPGHRPVHRAGVEVDARPARWRAAGKRWTCPNPTARRRPPHTAVRTFCRHHASSLTPPILPCRPEASGTGHSIRMTCPTTITFGSAIPGLSRRIPSTVTPNRPAIAPSVSPARTVYAEARPAFAPPPRPGRLRRRRRRRRGRLLRPSG